MTLTAEQKNHGHTMHCFMNASYWLIFVVDRRHFALEMLRRHFETSVVEAQI